MYHFFGMYDSVDVGNVAQRVRNDKGQNIRVTLEVDFVCNKGSQRIYIQSAWRMLDADKMEQEKRSLRLVSDSFRKLLIVGEHTKSWSDDFTNTFYTIRECKMLYLGDFSPLLISVEDIFLQI